MTSESQVERSPWPHRLAVLLACATFPLVWIGGLVTTTDAGMAVPDWPNTYGYNLFLYPWQSWLAGGWDLFIEHGHRLLAASVGLLTIGLLIAVWRTPQPRWLRGLAAAALALVIFQGVLGGMRVLLDERTLALLHGCTGPMFFALATAIALFTSQSWQRGDAPVIDSHATVVRRLAATICVLTYLQLVFGALLRHMPVMSAPTTFAHTVKSHLTLAGLLVLLILWFAWAVLRHFSSQRGLRRSALILVGLITVQVLLGAATWIVKYSVPVWASAWLPMHGFTIQAEGWTQTHIVTAHVAVGSLLLTTSTIAALLARHCLAAPATTIRTASTHAGLAT